MVQALTKEWLQQLQTDLLSEEGYYNGLIKQYRKNQLLLDDLLQENQSLQNTDANLYRLAIQVAMKLKWYAFNYLNEKEIVDLFQYHSKIILADKSFPLDDSLKLQFLTLMLEDRDALKKQLREAMLLNNEELTKNTIDISGIKSAPTVANWLKLYSLNLGNEAVNTLKLAEFYVRNQDYNQLTSDDKDSIKRLFNLYEKLKLSSFSPEGLEEEEVQEVGDKLVVMTGRGVQETIGSIIKTPTLQQSIGGTMPTPSSALSVPPASVPPPAMPPVVPLTSALSSFIIKEDDGDLILPPPPTSNNSTPMTTTNLDYPSAINQLITQLGLSFANETLKNRFNNIISSYLKGIRKEIELRDALARDQKTGGMGYDQIMINSVIDKIAILKKALMPEIKKIINKPSLAEGLTSPAEMVVPQSEAFKSGSEKLLVAPEDILLSAGESADLNKEKEQFISGPLSPPVTEVNPLIAQSIPMSSPSSEKNVWNLDLSSEVAESNLLTPPPADLSEAPGEINFGLFDNQPSDGPLNNFIPLEKDFLTGPAADDKNVSSKLNKDPSLQSGDLMGFNFNQSPEPPTLPSIPVADAPLTKSTPPESTIQSVYHTTAPTLKPVMEEIRVTPKIYGPIDELKTITMEDWRRWGTVKEGSKRILDKINLLAEESLVKKSQGIAAWKNSAVNRMYLDIGTEAIDNGLSIEQVIAKRQQENRPALTIEEFNAVSELNQNLRF